MKFEPESMNKYRWFVAENKGKKFKAYGSIYVGILVGYSIGLFGNGSLGFALIDESVFARQTITKDISAIDGTYYIYLKEKVRFVNTEALDISSVEEISALIKKLEL